ncbi:hypothetical protein CYMTET_45878 [Cymbomonas tetramitiformis]|uniref:Uncharacterized protein n=1 Tax=Cymbomonas tetramitiformis TaxID=36881 RepID=A0AAE0EZ91_9CHLO|nr:hypothetical protein CYMTET_45878 [Cymbomonas tetramitiformis]
MSDILRGAFKSSKSEVNDFCELAQYAEEGFTQPRSTSRDKTRRTRSRRHRTLLKEKPFLEDACNSTSRELSAVKSKREEHPITTTTEETVSFADTVVRATRTRSANTRGQGAFAGVVLELLQRLRDVRTKRHHIRQIFLHLCIFVFFSALSTVLYQRSNSYELVSSVQSTLVPPVYNVDFLQWLKTQTLKIWKDPICGDGVCQEPFEFPAFHRFGCKVDCGVAPLTAVLLYVEVAMQELLGYFSHGKVEEIIQPLHWNLCLRDAVRRNEGLEEVCWYRDDRNATYPKHKWLTSLQLPRGLWYIRVYMDSLQILRGKLWDISNESNHLQLYTFPAWEPCPAPPAPPGIPSPPASPQSPPLEPPLPPVTLSPTTIPPPPGPPLPITTSPTPPPTVAAWVVLDGRVPLASIEPEPLKAMPFFQRALSDASRQLLPLAHRIVRYRGDMAVDLVRQSYFWSRGHHSSPLLASGVEAITHLPSWLLE